MGRPADHNDWARVSQSLWSSAQEPGPFLPQTSMPRSWGQNMWQRLPTPPATHQPTLLAHPAGLCIFVSPLSMDLTQIR